MDQISSLYEKFQGLNLTIRILIYSSLFIGTHISTRAILDLALFSYTFKYEIPYPSSSEFNTNTLLPVYYYFIVKSLLLSIIIYLLPFILLKKIRETNISTREDASEINDAEKNDNKDKEEISRSSEITLTSTFNFLTKVTPIILLVIIGYMFYKFNNFTLSMLLSFIYILVPLILGIVLLILIERSFIKISILVLPILILSSSFSLFYKDNFEVLMKDSRLGGNIPVHIEYTDTNKKLFSANLLLTTDKAYYLATRNGNYTYVVEKSKINSMKISNISF